MAAATKGSTGDLHQEQIMVHNLTLYQDKLRKPTRSLIIRALVEDELEK